jgi:hypothetical protein
MSGTPDLAVMIRRLAASCLMILLATLDARGADAPVRLSITNDGSEPFRCIVLFGHWVTVDVGTVVPGEVQMISMMRGPPKGALHVPRFDGRQMMIENVLCGSLAAWGDSLDQIP